MRIHPRIDALFQRLPFWPLPISLLAVGVSIAPAVIAEGDVPAILDVDIENLVIYRQDVFDSARFATEPGPTTPLGLRSFMSVLWIGDVTTVNGVPAKGTLSVRGAFINLNPNPAPGTGIADTTNGLASDWIFDIQRADGSPIGTIMATGWAFGARAAGSTAPGQGNLAVVGGTGAFVGARGQAKEASAAAGARNVASVTEDPTNRRLHGGSRRRYRFELNPMVRPAFLNSASGPLLYHTDFKPVNAANPARKGESLTAAVSGLGPTAPPKDVAALFSSAPFQLAVSPVQVLVNGVAVETWNQIGWPGTADTYRVDFRVPADAPTGTARIQLVSAWISGPIVETPLQ
jgi:hypothetical protein